MKWQCIRKRNNVALDCDLASFRCQLSLGTVGAREVAFGLLVAIVLTFVVYVEYVRTRRAAEMKEAALRKEQSALFFAAMLVGSW